MKFRRKSTIIEAEQWFPDRTVTGVNRTRHGNVERWYVVTAHNQQVFLEPGDWIIAEPDNRGYYPCKDDIFQKTYERLDDAAS